MESNEFDHGKSMMKSMKIKTHSGGWMNNGSKSS
jgi:hypothetical protein